MKLWKCIAFGLLLWSVTLIWPDINLILTEQVMLKLLLGIGLVTLVYVIEQTFIHHDDTRDKPEDRSHNGNNHDSRPVTMTPVHS